MKKILICLLLALPLSTIYAQDIYFGMRLQGQMGQGGILAYVPHGAASGMAIEGNLTVNLKSNIQFETGIGLAVRKFGMQVIYDRDDTSPDADYSQTSQVLTFPARIRLRSELTSKTNLFLNVGYQLGAVLCDQFQYDWESPPYSEQKEIKQHGGTLEHGFELGLEVEFPLSEKHHMGLGVNYQNIRRAAGLDNYYSGRFHLAGFTIRFARRALSSTN